MVAAPSRARAEPDPWVGPDKALHFGVSAGIAGAAYAVGAAVFDARRDALILGGAIAITVGGAKELADLAGLGDPSWKDFAWDAMGTVTGLAIAWSLDLAIRGVSPSHPLLVAPARTAGGTMGLVLRF